MRIAAGVLSLMAFVPLGAAGLTPSLARTAFQEARALARRDGGRLWGRSLEGPILVVDPETLAVMANRPDRRGALALKEGVFQGVLPKGTPVANTDVVWNGVHWTEILAQDLEEQDPALRRRLLLHEAFHRIQKDLGLLRAEAPCGHLETEEGRVWLRLEWRALRRALEREGAGRKAALRDALAFRAARYRRFPEGRKGETALETDEGLAEYTGLRLAHGHKEARLQAVRALEAWDGQPHVARSFPYASGPAYALLLDEAAPGWRTRASRAEDLPSLFPPSWRASLPERPDEAPYGGETIRAQERAAARTRAARVAQLRSRFQDGALLVLPGPFKVSFNPNLQEEVDGLGRYHPGLKAQGPWGSLSTSEGGLVAYDWLTLTLPAPADPSQRTLTGPGYTLDLAEGWTLAPGPRPGDWTVRKD